MRKLANQMEKFTDPAARDIAKSILCGLILVALTAHLTPAQAQTGELVTVESGGLPIILSAPHGGGDAIPDVPERRGLGVRLFRWKSDAGTARLTEKLADALEERFGKRPYVVIARFHRKFLDANRPADLAYESDNARPAYEAYHHAIAEARRDIVRRWGRGILLDIHGQAAEPGAIFRGTQNGKTVSHLVGRFGEEALAGETSLFGQLAEQGVPVIPPIGSGDREIKYQGGYIVVTHGSASGGTIDAIQLELGRELRSPDAGTEVQLADAIYAFAGRYLPDTESDLEDAGDKPVRVGVYRDVGAGRSLTDLMQALRGFDGVSVRGLMAEDIRSGALDEVDVLIQPGGSGGKQGRHLREDGREEIRRFLRDGGGYIGICAGAYLASTDYEWSLDVLDAKVVDRKHWARGNGTVQIELSKAGQHLLRTGREQLAIHYAQGPLLAPAGDPDIADYETLATFKTEIAKNGAPEGVMKGTTAIALGRFGRGRVVCFSPHPEKTDGLEALVHYAIEFVGRGPTPQRAPSGRTGEE
ncbi:MAG: BPL-N domain-containing protein [Verrucomicrobiales bacterium]